MIIEKSLSIDRVFTYIIQQQNRFYRYPIVPAALVVKNEISSALSIKSTSSFSTLY